MVCDYAQLLGAFGGKFLDSSGKPAFASGGGLQALQFMKALLDQGLADPASTSRWRPTCSRPSPRAGSR